MNGWHLRDSIAGVIALVALTVLALSVVRWCT